MMSRLPSASKRRTETATRSINCAHFSSQLKWRKRASEPQDANPPQRRICANFFQKPGINARCIHCRAKHSVLHAKKLKHNCKLRKLTREDGRSPLRAVQSWTCPPALMSSTKWFQIQRTSEDCSQTQHPEPNTSDRRNWRSVTPPALGDVPAVPEGNHA